MRWIKRGENNQENLRATVVYNIKGNSSSKSYDSDKLPQGEGLRVIKIFLGDEGKPDSVFVTPMIKKGNQYETLASSGKVKGGLGKFKEEELEATPTL